MSSANLGSFCPCTFSTFSFFTFTPSGCKFSLSWLFFSILVNLIVKGDLFLAYYLFLFFYINVMCQACLLYLISFIWKHLIKSIFSVLFFFFFNWWVLLSTCLTERILRSEFANHCSREEHFYLFKKLLKMHLCSCFKSE